MESGYQSLNLLPKKSRNLHCGKIELFLSMPLLVLDKCQLARIFHTGSSRGAANPDAEKEGDGLRQRLYVSYCPRSNSKLTQYPSGVRKPQQNRYEICGLALKTRKRNIVPLSRSSSQGFALPMVLWAIAFLAGLIILAAGSINSWLEEESHAQRSFHARQLALSGLAIGMNPGIKANDPALIQGDPSDKEGESFSVQLNNEAGFINPNIWLAKSDRIIFQRLFEKWGVPQKDQEVAIDGLIDWQSPTELRSEHGAKRSEYEKIGLEGYPPNTPFLDTREMGMVIGFAPVMKANPKWKHFFSTFNPGKININFCSPDMFTDLLGLTPEQTEAFVKLTAGPDGISGTEDDLIFNDINQAAQLMGVSGLQKQLLLNYFSAASNVIRRINSTGTYHGISHHIIVIMGDSLGRNILSWQEQ